MDESDKLKRVVDARMKLKNRFAEKMRLTPSVADLAETEYELDRVSFVRLVGAGVAKRPV